MNAILDSLLAGLSVVVISMIAISVVALSVILRALLFIVAGLVILWAMGVI